MINYVNGDATRPIGEGPKFLIHVVNDLGLWGAGFVLALSSRWPQPEAAYYAWEKEEGLRLGHTQIVQVEEDIWVVNMVGQRGVGRNWSNPGPPIRYKAVRNCLKDVAAIALQDEYRGSYETVSIHGPRFGAGLAGGDWNEIEKLINEELIAKGLKVTIYDYDPS